MPKKTATTFTPHVTNDILYFYMPLASLAPDSLQYKPYNPVLRSSETREVLVELSCPIRWVANHTEKVVALKPRGMAFVAKQVATALAYIHSADINTETP